MKLEFTREEVEKIVLDHANTLVQGQAFNTIGCKYSSIPSTVTLSFEGPAAPKEEA